MAALPELDSIWLDCARRLGIPVERGGEAYVHWDTRALHLADDAELDADDSVAQLVLHEICHWLVEGEAARALPDWGLDNRTDDDAVREQAAVRLQAHLTERYGLRQRLYPTTVVRGFFDALPPEALGAPEDPDPSVPLAWRAASLSARPPFARALHEALAATVERLALPRHLTSGHPLVSDERRCGSCAWRGRGGLCQHGPAGPRVGPDALACVRHEARVECLACGACCREAFDLVPVGPREALRTAHPAMVVVQDGLLAVRRTGERCAALRGGPVGGSDVAAEAPYTCAIYEARPRTCRELALGGPNCLLARRRVGLSA